ncbi:hypothetical protein GCM10007301_17200 [Azorhizobium oxalatiphilum]|uniref:TPM domain-containing protein n=2 Tax=Azorhizobium oxalatiphilum TaxID=980631 RepID=A0A917F9C1_9HYPH|nr:hypothetical protein GCM10007301_17200 [Azorhizobium oxalatiphilum]
MDQDARTRIEQAVMAAEARTSAEIRVVVLNRPAAPVTLHVVALAACVALVLPWPLAFLFPHRAMDLFAVQALLFVVLGGLLLGVPALAQLAIPRAVRRMAVRAAALDRFLALGIHLTESRTGLMILVAVPDRMVEVVADAEVMTKLGQGFCDEVVLAVSRGGAGGDIAAGLVEGVNHCGKRLSETFPEVPGGRNALPDHVVLA